MKRWTALAVLGVALLAAACDPPTVGPSTGDSHTNWLRSCEADADCGSLTCWCGRCTNTCGTDSRCGPGTACVSAAEASEVATCSGAIIPAQGICLPGVAEAHIKLAVDTSTRRQTLVGFGAAASYMVDALANRRDRAALDAAMFADLGLDVLRLRSRYGEVPDEQLRQEQDLVVAATRSLGARPLVLLTAWSPPAQLKRNRSMICRDGPADCTLHELPDGRFDYAGFAEHWRRAVQAYEKAGLSPDYLTIQNNPNWAPAAGTAAEAAKLLPIEGEEQVFVDGTSRSARFPGYAEASRAVVSALATLPKMPKLLAPELSSARGAELYLQHLDTSSIAAIGHHLYGSIEPELDFPGLKALGALRERTELPVFQTEMQANGFDTALAMHHVLVSEGAAMYLQTMLVAPHSSSVSEQEALIGLEGDHFVLYDPYFAMQHFAKFTHPGDVRRDVAVSDAKLLASAWSHIDSGELVVVVINPSPATLTLSLDIGGTSQGPFSVARTTFDTSERMAELGAFSQRDSLPLASRSMATLRFAP